MGELAFIGVAIAIVLAASMASRHVSYTESDETGSFGLGRALGSGDDLGDAGDIGGE